MTPADRERIREAARAAVQVSTTQPTPAQLATISLLAEHVRKAARQAEPDTAA